MPPKLAKAAAAVDAADGRKQPTAQEAYLFYTIIKNMKGKPEIDWAAVATDAGFKNAETAKVRYGQIKRKLGLDNWNAGKPKDKDEDAGDNGAPETPAAARTKKAAATPSTSGTGAGVKKRGSTGKRGTNSNPRSRKAKSQALVKMEEDIDQAQPLDDDDEDMLALESPTKNPASRIKPEFGAVGHNTNNNEYANFPSVLPDAVLERQAILVNVSGNWTLSPVPIEIHAQWLARLPAHIQTRFYTQAAGNNNNNNLGHQTSGGNGNGNGNDFLVDGNDADNDAAAVEAQLLSDHFGGRAGGGMQLSDMSNMGTLSMSMAGVNMGYLSAVGIGQHGNGNGAAAAGAGDGRGDHGNGTGNNGNQATIDLHSIPMHPSYLAQMEREAREQEARDQAALFGDQSGFHC